MYTPNKTEWALLKLVHSEGKLCNGVKALDSAEAQKKINLKEEDKIFLTDMRLVRFDGQRVFVTYEGKTYMENHCYNRTKEWASWVFGISAVAAAIFSLLTFIYTK